MATHSSVLAWRTPGMGGLPSLGSHRVGHDWSDLAAAPWKESYDKPFGGGGVQSLSHIWLFAVPCTAALQASTLSQSLLKVVFVKLVMLFNQPLLWLPLLLLPSTFLSIRICSMSQFFTSGVQNFGVSVSLGLPMNIQGWFPLEWAGLISLQSKGLSRIFFRTTVQKHQFFGSQPSLWSNSRIHIHDYW